MHEFSDPLPLVGEARKQNTSFELCYFPSKESRIPFDSAKLWRIQHSCEQYDQGSRNEGLV